MNCGYKLVQEEAPAQQEASQQFSGTYWFSAAEGKEASRFLSAIQSRGITIGITFSGDEMNIFFKDLISGGTGDTMAVHYTATDKLLCVKETDRIEFTIGGGLWWIEGLSSMEYTMTADSLTLYTMEQSFTFSSNQTAESGSESQQEEADSLFPQGTVLTSHQAGRYNAFLIDRSALSKVFLSTDYASATIPNAKTYTALVFDLPGSAEIDSMDDSSLHALDETTLIQYSYQLYSSYAFETFLEKADGYQILEDGSSKVAMYVYTERNNGYGYALFSVPDYSKNAKIRIKVVCNNFNKTDTEAEILAETEKRLRAEYERVKSSYKVESFDMHWGIGVFSAFELRDASIAPYVVLELSDMVVCRVFSADSVSVCMVPSGDTISFELTAYSSASYYQKEEPEYCQTFALDDGTVAEMYYNSGRCYVQIPVTAFRSYDSEKMMYVQIHPYFSSSTGVDEVIASAKALLSHITIVK